MNQEGEVFSFQRLRWQIFGKLVVLDVVPGTCAGSSEREEGVSRIEQKASIAYQGGSRKQRGSKELRRVGNGFFSNCGP